MVTPRSLMLLTCLVGLAGCTPLGLWVYGDPYVTVMRVRLDPDELGGSQAAVFLRVRNPNDYPLATARMELRLQLDGVPFGWFEADSTLAVAKSLTSSVALPLALDSRITASQLEAFQSGSHSYAVAGRITFTTPFGKRKVRFADAGAMTFSPAGRGG
jgi:LEA14-like dessication related protein